MWSCEIDQREMLCTAVESRGRKWRFLRDTSLFDSYIRSVAKRESPPSDSAAMLNPRISHSRIDVQIRSKVSASVLSKTEPEGCSGLSRSG